MEHEEGQSTSNGKKKKKTSEEKQSDDPNADQLAEHDNTSKSLLIQRPGKDISLGSEKFARIRA